MASLENLTIEDLKTFAKERSIGSYENIFRQQLEGISITLSIPKPTPKSTPKPFSKPKNVLLRQLQDPKNIHLHLS